MSLGALWLNTIYSLQSGVCGLRSAVCKCHTSEHHRQKISYNLEKKGR